MSQIISITPEQSYAVRFWLSDDVGGNALKVTLGTTTLFNGTTPDTGFGVYEQPQLRRHGERATADLSFVSRYLSSALGVGAGIDDVSVTHLAVGVPEPATLMLLAMGLLGIVVSGRRRRSS